MNANVLSVVAASVSAVGAMAAVIVAVLAWSTTRYAARATGDLSRIEARRWHHDLTPQFTFDFIQGSGDLSVLNVWFNGPDALGELTVSLTIRNDRPRFAGVADCLLPPEITTPVWGPYRFSPDYVYGADHLGRAAGPVKVLPGDGYQFALERTPAPSHTGQKGWHDLHAKAPVRLALRCTSRDAEPWTVYHVVPTVQDAAPQGRPSLQKSLAFEPSKLARLARWWRRQGSATS